MQIKTFQDLTVWRKGHQLVLDIYKVTRKFPSEEKFGIISQIRRSSSSVCANISEGYRKGTKEYLRFLSVAQGSIEETKYHLLLSKDLAYLSNTDYDHLLETANEVAKMLNGLKTALTKFR